MPRLVKKIMDARTKKLNVRLNKSAALFCNSSSSPQPRLLLPRLFLLTYMPPLLPPPPPSPPPPPPYFHLPCPPQCPLGAERVETSTSVLLPDVDIAKEISCPTRLSRSSSSISLLSSSSLSSLLSLLSSSSFKFFLSSVFLSSSSLLIVPRDLAVLAPTQLSSRRRRGVKEAIDAAISRRGRLPREFEEFKKEEEGPGGGRGGHRWK